MCALPTIFWNLKLRNPRGLFSCVSKNSLMHHSRSFSADRELSIHSKPPTRLSMSWCNAIMTYMPSSDAMSNVSIRRADRIHHRLGKRTLAGSSRYNSADARVRFVRLRERDLVDKWQLRRRLEACNREVQKRRHFNRLNCKDSDPCLLPANPTPSSFNPLFFNHLSKGTNDIVNGWCVG